MSKLSAIGRVLQRIRFRRGHERLLDPDPLDGEEEVAVEFGVVGDGAVPEEKPKSKAEQLVDDLNRLGDAAEKTKKLLIELNGYFASLVKIHGGNFSEIREKADEWITKRISGGEESVKAVLEKAVEERFDRLRQPIIAVLKTQNAERQVEYRGIEITLSAEFDPTKIEEVDQAAQFMLAKVKEVEDAVQETIQAGMEEAEQLANGTLQQLLGGDGDGTASDPLIGYQILDFLGTSASVAKSAAEAVKLLNDVREGDGKLTADLSSDLDGVFSKHGTTMLEGKSFVDGIKLAVDAGFLVEGTATLTAAAKAQLSEDVWAKIEGQADAYFKSEATLQGQATIGLFDGIKVEASASFEAQAAASASIQVDIQIGRLEMQAAAGAEAVAGVQAKASGRLVITGDSISLVGKANFRLGAEVTATAALKVSEEFKLSIKASAVAGLAGEVGGSFTIENGKLSLSINLGAALGGGGAVGLDLEVDFQVLLEKIAREIEAYLLIRWEHRHLDLGDPPPITQDRRSAVNNAAAGLPEAMQVDFSKCLLEKVDSMKPAIRPLPIGADEEFLRQLHLLCRGMWKRYEKLLESSTTDAVKKAEVQPVDGVKNEVARQLNVCFRPENFQPIWHQFNKGLGDAANRQYSNVILVRYDPQGAVMPLGSFDKLSALSGSFELTRVSANPQDVMDSLDDNELSQGVAAKFGGGFGSNDRLLVKALGEAIRQSGLNINSVDNCRKSLKEIAKAYWKIYKESPETQLEDFPASWWEANKSGDKQSYQMSLFFNRLLCTMYKVTPPAAGSSQGAKFGVAAIDGSDAAEVANSYEVRIQGLWSKMFKPVLDKDKLTATKLDLPTSRQLLQVGFDNLDRWLEEILSNEQLLAAFNTQAEALITAIGGAFGAKGASAIRQEIAALKTAVNSHVENIEQARAAFQKLAEDIKQYHDSSGVVNQEVYVAKVAAFQADRAEYGATYANVLAVDDESGAANTKALDLVCAKLLNREKKT